MGVDTKSRKATGKQKDEPETVSDAEQMSSEDEDAGLVDPDDYEGEDEEAEAGLKARYEDALKDGAMDPKDASFANYVAAASLQR